jgi:general L-amino acid transport system substrate-binding protein
MRRVLVLLCLLLPVLAQASSTVDKIRKANALVCGIDQNEAEYSTTDDHGARVAFDQDICKEVAAAVMGPGARIVIKGYPDDQTAMDALSSGEVDLIASLSADFTHATDQSLNLTRPILYDGVTVMVPISSGVTKTSQLSGKKICFIAETEIEVNLRAWFEVHHLVFVPFPFQEEGEMEAAYITNNCTGIAGDITRLAVTRAAFGTQARDHILLAGTISKDPLAIASRSSDPQWSKLLDWVVNALIQAEESGITAASINSIHTSREPVVERLLGNTRELGRPVGLDDRWAFNAIAAAGNYGEIFSRDLGADSPLKLTRGQNALWTNGGLMYAEPFK